ncbi:hypothetical protein C8R43DRAFT_87626 [Mycena crocata]|nr:hypothetical protein C8R43DRAFT_87626 [Mycena crocata]
MLVCRKKSIPLETPQCPGYPQPFGSTQGGNNLETAQIRFRGSGPTRVHKALDGSFCGDFGMANYSGDSWCVATSPPLTLNQYFPVLCHFHPPMHPLPCHSADFFLNTLPNLNFISGPKLLTCACAGLVFGEWCVFNISQNIHYMCNSACGPAPTRMHNLF